MTDTFYLKNLRTPSREDALRILVSACLTGIACGYDGTANGEYPGVLKLMNYDNVKLVKFCPEDFSLGSPREMCDIYGGTGDDVLDGKAKVLTETGKDWTKGMLGASEKMLQIARKEDVELAVMMDISAACGSQVIYAGNRFSENNVYQTGRGVCAGLLLRNGFNVICQRDFASLEIVCSKIDAAHQIDPAKKDHHETEWHKQYFKK